MSDLYRAFIKHHGYGAGIYKNYEDYLALIKKLVEESGIKDVKFEDPTRDIKYYVTTQEDMVKNVTGTVGGTRIFLGTIPHMIREKGADPGCYFVLRGQEYAIPIRESKRKDLVIVTRNVKRGAVTYSTMARVRCDGTERPLRLGIVDYDIHVILDGKEMPRDSRRGTQMVDLMFLLKVSPEDLETHIRRMSSSEHVTAETMIRLSRPPSRMNEKETQIYIAEASRVLPRKKERGMMMFLSHVLVSLLGVELGVLKETDIDDYEYKSFTTPGESLFRSYMRSFYKALEKKERFEATMTTELESSIYKPIRTGVAYRGERKVTGYSNGLGRKSPTDAIVSVRKIVFGADTNSPLLKMRMIHKSQMMFVCPSETPETKEVGLIKSLALLCTVSGPVEAGGVEEAIRKHEDEEGSMCVFLNGRPLCYVSDAKVESVLREMKKEERYNQMTIAMKPRGIMVEIGQGRLLRPMIKASEAHTIDGEKSWKEYLEQGTVEYVDPISAFQAKERGMKNAFDISVSGLPVTCIPYANRNQCARIVFAASMMKQGISSPTVRTKEMLHDNKWLMYGQMGCSNTTTTVASELRCIPNGTNVVLAIMSYGGSNQEDSVIVKKSSLERGLFSTAETVIQRTHLNQTHKIIKTWENKKITYDARGMVESSYDDRGIIKRGSKTSKDGVLFAYLSAVDGHPKLILETMKSRTDKKYVVENVEILEYSEGRRCISITMTSTKMAEEGDKISSRHAQKGVIGRIMDERDMPFTGRGISPDVIMNPHAIPSRMTIGHMVEMLVGKSAASRSKVYNHDDGSFGDVDMEELENTLVKQGYVRSGDETMISGITGEEMTCRIFTGIPYYLTLKHHIREKIRKRTDGAVDMSSRQPMSGSQGGGLRIGEMEIDCLISHGASEVLKNIYKHSDEIKARVCGKCQAFRESKDKCKTCNETLTEVSMPYSLQVLRYLTECCGVVMKVTI